MKIFYCKYFWIFDGPFTNAFDSQFVTVEAITDSIYIFSVKGLLLFCFTVTILFNLWGRKKQGMSCDGFLGRTHAPRTSRLRCARTRVRTPNFKRSHFAPALQCFFSNFSAFLWLNKMIQNRKGRSKAGRDVLKTFF